MENLDFKMPQAEVLGSKFTLRLKNLIDINYPLGLTDYPIWEESYRTVLNKKLLKHYMLHEIGAETPAMFVYYLNEALEMIMPYYVQLFDTQIKEINPFLDYHIKETMDREGKSDAKSDTTNNSDTVGTSAGNSLDVHSSTPQNMLQIGDIRANTYADDASMSNSSANSTSTSNIIGSAKSNIFTEDDYIKIITGHKDNPTDNMKKIRDMIINIDRMIITDKEVKSCFMMIW